jgi:hypothetical protein
MSPIYWRCLDCTEHGETTGTERGNDQKHVEATGHATITSQKAVK